MKTRRGFLGQISAGVAYQTIAANASQAAGITMVAPEDGGTPRDPKRITRVTDREFRIAASVEEGKSVLTHAVSRVDLLIQNPGAKTDVTLHLELSGDGTRTNHDRSVFGGMPRRNYVYVQASGDIWRRVDGTASGWVAKVTIPVPPGETKLGLSPWYNYGDLLAFVKGLGSHPHLEKTVIGKSDGGRELWELTITDPAVSPDRKRRVFWHAREHAYESFSSLAMEGLVQFLLSGEAAELRKTYAFSLHPMTNVDGVALGYEYRSGYDYPEPRGPAIGRLTFAAMDRLRPHLAVAWHNWIAPVDEEEVSFTDEENGRATRRAWDLFTQRFPTPRAAGHVWRSGSNPLEKNWHGRKLDENNVHQYVMQRYGTRVWGWEMPWWGRDDGDPLTEARTMGAAFARALFGALAEIEKGVVNRPEAAPVSARRFETHEFVLTGGSFVANPYKDAALVGEFVSPAGKQISVEGFYCGGDKWKLRFVPAEEGTYRYILRGEGVALFSQGRLMSSPGSEAGFIQIHPQNRYAFAWSDGTAFFPMGDTCYGLHDDSPVTPELRRQYLDTRRGQRFNFVRMSIGHSPVRAEREPARYWAWGGTPQAPDLDRLNPAFFDSLEEVLGEMQARGMNAELLLMNTYRSPFRDPALWTPTRQRTWIRHVVARLASYRNIFLWTIANEYETYPDGRYRLDREGDVAWAKSVARDVHRMDPYSHPVTVHPVISSSVRGPSTRDEFDPPWRIGGLFGNGNEMDVLSQQTSSVYRANWDERQQCWLGDAEGIEQSIEADRIYGKPVLNTENGYEYLPGYATNKQQVYHTDRVRKASWRIVCAGGYFAAGFISTIAHSDVWDRLDPAYRHPFLVRDAGAAGQLKYLYEFFTRLPYWRMVPRRDLVRGAELCLAAAGEAYVVYLPNGQSAHLRLDGAPKDFEARWFNPRSGAFHANAPVISNGEFQAPDQEDWVLLVERRRV